MGEFSNTPENVTMMFKCGCHGHSGCGKIMSEGYLKQHGKCKKCGGIYVSPYYPQNKWQLFKCYLKLVVRGEAWV